MSLDEKIGQLFCPIGSSFDEEQIKEFIEKYKPGAMMYRPMESHKIKIFMKIYKIFKNSTYVGRKFRKWW